MKKDKSYLKKTIKGLEINYASAILTIPLICFVVLMAGAYMMTVSWIIGLPLLLFGIGFCFLGYYIIRYLRRYIDGLIEEYEELTATHEIYSAETKHDDDVHHQGIFEEYVDVIEVEEDENYNYDNDYNNNDDDTTNNVG